MKSTPKKRGEQVKAEVCYGVYINGNLESLQMNPRPGDEWPLTPVFILPALPESINALRWQVEQTYLRCEDAEITDPWEIAALVLKSIGIHATPTPRPSQRRKKGITENEVDKSV